MTVFGSALSRLGRSLALTPRVTTARAGEGSLQQSGVTSSLRPSDVSTLASQVRCLVILVSVNLSVIVPGRECEAASVFSGVAGHYGGGQEAGAG